MQDKSLQGVGSREHKKYFHPHGWKTSEIDFFSSSLVNKFKTNFRTTFDYFFLLDNMGCKQSTVDKQEHVRNRANNRSNSWKDKASRSNRINSRSQNLPPHRNNNDSHDSDQSDSPPVKRVGNQRMRNNHFSSDTEPEQVRLFHSLIGISDAFLLGFWFFHDHSNFDWATTVTRYVHCI